MLGFFIQLDNILKRDIKQNELLINTLSRRAVRNRVLPNKVCGEDLPEPNLTTYLTMKGEGI